MKKKFILCLLLVVSMTIVSMPVLAAENDDKCGDWIGNYNGVSYRYCHSYIGNNTWNSTINLVQFWNTNSYQVKITYYTTIANKTYGPYVQYLDTSSKNHPSPQIAISEGERVFSIAVEPSR